jgi:hypothetical protein
MLAYPFALAYIFAGITYWSAVALGLWTREENHGRQPE